MHTKDDRSASRNVPGPVSEEVVSSSSSFSVHYVSVLTYKIIPGSKRSHKRAHHFRLRHGSSATTGVSGWEFKPRFLNQDEWQVKPI